MKYKKLTDEQFVRNHAAIGQDIANLTKTPTDLYRGSGFARFVCDGWPCVGSKVATFTPNTQPVAWAQ